MLEPSLPPMQQELLDKHYLRKHGANATTARRSACALKTRTAVRDRTGQDAHAALGRRGLRRASSFYARAVPGFSRRARRF